MAVKMTKNNITRDLKRIEREMKALPKETYKYWVSITPKDTGNARRSTYLIANTIHASYVYASRLDEGYSKQAPEGMTKPTEKFIEQRVKKILGK